AGAELRSERGLGERNAELPFGPAEDVHPPLSENHQTVAAEEECAERRSGRLTELPPILDRYEMHPSRRIRVGHLPGVVRDGAPGEDRGDVRRQRDRGLTFSVRDEPLPQDRDRRRIRPWTGPLTAREEKPLPELAPGDRIEPGPGIRNRQANGASGDKSGEV